MTSNHSDEHVKELIHDGIFNPEALEMNRAGHISRRQKRRLYGRLAFWGSIALLDAAILIPFILTKNAVVIFLGLLLVLSLAYPCYTEIRPVWEDIQNDKPRAVAGGIHKKYNLKRTDKGKLRTAFCSIRVGREVFSVSPATYDRLFEGGFYRVYYVENTRTVINIEPL